MSIKVHTMSSKLEDQAVAVMKHLLLKRMESSLLIGGDEPPRTKKISRSSEIGLKRTRDGYALILEV